MFLLYIATKADVMKPHNGSGFPTVLFRLAVLAFGLAGIFHFFTFVLLRRTAEVQPIKKQIRENLVSEEVNEARNSYHLLKPEKPLKKYQPVFQPKELKESIQFIETKPNP